MKSITKTVGIVAAGALLLSGCAAGTPQTEETAGGDTAARGALLTIGQLGDLASWDPSQAHVGHALVPYQLVYDTLILREPDGELSPMLATEWSYNDDRTVLTWICARRHRSRMASRSTPRRWWPTSSTSRRATVARQCS